MAFCGTANTNLFKALLTHNNWYVPEVSTKVRESILAQVAAKPPLIFKDSLDSAPLEVVSKGQLKFNAPILEAPNCRILGSGNVIESTLDATVFVPSIRNTYL